eukprot:scaffold38029_cov238-Skeletonema_marinoi.AAC.1
MEARGEGELWRSGLSGTEVRQLSLLTRRFRDSQFLLGKKLAGTLVADPAYLLLSHPAPNSLPTSLLEGAIRQFPIIIIMSPFIAKTAVCSLSNHL